MIVVDLKFLSHEDIVNIKIGDFRTLKYENKNKQSESIYDKGKKDYYERRGVKRLAKRPKQIRELESKLNEHELILCEWSSNTLLTFVFSSGIIAYVTVNYDTLDITQVLFDRYCVGKLLGQNVSAVILSSSHILFVYVERLATLISYGSNVESSNIPRRIANKDPHVQTIQLAGPARRSERHVSWTKNVTGLLVVVWSSVSSDPVPWSPVPEDRANVHLYHINGSHMKLVSYLQLENETLSVKILKTQSNIVQVIEQIMIQKNGVCLEWTMYETTNSTEGVSKLSMVEEKLQCNLPAPARVVHHSPNEIQLLVACIDGSLHIVHRISGLTHSVQAGFIASEVQWPGDILIASEERGRLQCYDRALAVLHYHEKCLDLAQYFREPRRTTLVASQALQNRNLLLLSFSGGPLAFMRITHPRLPIGYMHIGRHGRAIALLRALDWSTDGERCLAALQDVVRCALRAGLNATAESVVQAALGTYFQNRANSSPTAQRFAPSVHDLARKFFHHLLRRGRLDKALSLAVELGACDLFADARWAAVRAGMCALADEAHALATAAAARVRTSSVHDSTCSESCSQCSTHSSRSASDDETSYSNHSDTRRVPPLPTLPPLPSCPTVMPVPIVPHEPISTNSIRPLHQYLDRDLTIWNTDVSNDPAKILPTESPRSISNPAHRKTWLNVDSAYLNYTQSSKPDKQLLVSNHLTRVKVHDNVNINPVSKVYNERPMNFNKMYQIGSHNIASSSTYNTASSSIYNTIHRHRDEPTTSYNRKTCNDRINNNIKPTLKYPGEKNKVKFSDTVTIAVVPENGNPRERSERAGSLPRVHLANWPSSPASSTAPTGTMLDYVEV